MYIYTYICVRVYIYIINCNSNIYDSCIIYLLLVRSETYNATIKKRKRGTVLGKKCKCSNAYLNTSRVRVIVVFSIIFLSYLLINPILNILIN